VGQSSNVLGDLGPPKTLQPNFDFGSVRNKNFDENTPCQIKEYISKRLLIISKRLLTGTKPTYNEHEKTQKKVLVGCKDRPYRAVISLP
jgi:hypothetical protein